MVAAKKHAPGTVLFTSGGTGASGRLVERSVFGFIIRYSKRDQLLIVPLVIGTMVVYYLSLDLPKTIINEAIQGERFPQPDATARFLGFDLSRLEYLLALSLIFLGLIVLKDRKSVV